MDSAVLDPDTSNNRVTFTTAVSATAGLAITKTDSPDPVMAGAELVYTLQVSNGGPSTAQDVVLVDTLPAGTTLVSAVGGTGAVACALSGPGVVSCDIGDLDPGQSVTIFITVKVNANVPNGTVLVNTAEATSPTDPDGASVSTETTVQTEAELCIEKTGVKPAGNPAGALIYRITVYNKAGMAPDDTPTSGTGGAVRRAQRDGDRQPAAHQQEDDRPVPDTQRHLQLAPPPGDLHDSTGPGRNRGHLRDPGPNQGLGRLHPEHRDRHQPDPGPGHRKQQRHRDQRDPGKYWEEVTGTV